MVPDQDFRKIRLELHFFKTSKIVIFHFSDSGKTVGIFEETKPKITSRSRNLQENVRVIFESVQKRLDFWKTA